MRSGDGGRMGQGSPTLPELQGELIGEGRSKMCRKGEDEGGKLLLYSRAAELLF